MMNRFIVSAYILLGVIAITSSLSSCQKEVLEGVDGDAFVRTEVMADSIGIDILTKKGYAKNNTEASLPTLDDFKIQLENTKSDILSQWNNYTEIPEFLKVVPGSYKMVASDGSSLSSLPAFETPVYGAEHKFTIAAGETYNVELSIKPLAAKVDLVFDALFPEMYSYYEVALKTTGDSLLFTELDQNKEAYFVPNSTLKIRMFVKLPTEKKIYTYTFDTKVEVVANGFYHVKVKPVRFTADISVNIITDLGVNEIVVSPDLTDDYLVKGPPSFVHSDFVNGALSTTEGKKIDRAAVMFNVRAGLKKAIIKFIPQEGSQLLTSTLSTPLASQSASNSNTMTNNGFSDAELRTLFGTEGIDILDPAQTDKVARLRELGFTWSAELDTPDEAMTINRYKPVVFNFREVAKSLNTDKEVTTQYQFSFELEDEYEQILSNPSSFTINVLPPVFTILKPTVVECWGSKAYLSVSYERDRESYFPDIYLSKDNGTTWFLATQEIVKQEVGMVYYLVMGLTPQTNYQFKGVFRGDVHSSSKKEFTTETPHQVPNANMQEWNMWKKKKGGWFGYAVPVYDPWLKGGTPYWDTNRNQTTQYGFTNQYTTVSPTVYYERGDAGRAAEIRTVNYATLLNISSAGDVANITSGKLVIGTIAGNDGPTLGRPFASRPTSLTFEYQYLPYGEDTFDALVRIYGEGNVVIGEGQFSYKASTNMDNFEVITIDITYSRMDMVATKIGLQLLSSKENPKVRKNAKVFYPDNDNAQWNTHWGSALRVDNFRLNY